MTCWMLFQTDGLLHFPILVLGVDGCPLVSQFLLACKFGGKDVVGDVISVCSGGVASANCC